MSRTPSPALRAAVATVKVGVAAAIAMVAVGPAVAATQDVVAERAEAQGPTASDLAAQAHLERLMTRHHCSTDGLGPDVIPGSALVERDDRVQRVSFDEGWAIFQGDARGALLAVCEAPLR